MKISISGIRGIYGIDFSPSDVLRFCDGFSKLIKNGKCVIGRDTRKTGEMIEKLVSATMLERGNRCSEFRDCTKRQWYLEKQKKLVLE